MPGIKSSDKGKNYERTIARELSKWCGFELIRTPMSGAWPGTSGDILPKNRSQFFPFLVECKKVEGWTMEQIMSGNGLFSEWVEQVYAEMERDRAMGHDCESFLLIFSRNRKPDYIATRYADVSGWILGAANHMIVYSHETLYVCELTDFLSAISYNTILSSVRSYEPEITAIPAIA